jgi:hypothetical protein
MINEHLRHTCDSAVGWVRFIENHDEPRANTVFEPSVHRAVAVVAATVPGALLLHEGQLDGRRVKIPVQLGRRPFEESDRALRSFYRSCS